MAARYPGEFNFQSWANSAHFCKATITVLEVQRLITIEALQMAAPSDISGLPITVDQKELLINAIRKLPSGKDRPQGSLHWERQRGSGRYVGDQESGEITGSERRKMGSPRESDRLHIYRVGASSYRVEPRSSRSSTTFDLTLERLGLTDKYPMGITVMDVMVIRAPSQNVAASEADIPMIMLRRLIMSDYRGRDRLDIQGPSSSTVVVTSRTLEQHLAGLAFGPQSTNTLNPLDVFLLTLSCCDLILRQTLYEKMYLCKLALPLICPLSPDGVLIFCMWALRGIVLEWKGRGGISMETNLVNTRLYNVSFVRVGRPDVSKSRLMNDVLRDDGHSTFFHRDCPHGMTERLHADGTVEISWYLPSGVESDFCGQVCMFSNLRGDAAKFSRQVDILKAVSSLLVVIVDLADISNSLSTIRNLLEHPQFTAFLVTAQRYPVERGTMEKSVKQLYSCLKESNELNIIFGFDTIRTLNAVELKLKIRQFITEKTIQTKDPKSRPIEKDLEDIRRCVEKEKVVVDEDLEECRAGQAMAEKINQTTEHLPSVRVKQELLQLQGDHWLQWSRLLKKKHRMGGNKDEEGQSIHTIDTINKQMKELRDKQAVICKEPSQLVRTLLDVIEDAPSITSLMFAMRWEKLLLDNKCRDILPALYKRYHAKWNSLRKVKAQSTPDKNELKLLQGSVENAERELQRSSLGVEHLIREMSQMYEATIESAPNEEHDILSKVRRLPERISRLMLAGHPMEVMDGEAANIPVTYARDILKATKGILGGDKKVFILSVLGVQSAGKSTLLNTMFGMQFAVSAGRCTRGVYTQLVPVAPESRLPFDYIFVDDTEGLRAPELAQRLNHDHDNELATLAIGLGDVTLVVIKGENYSELSDVLQIVVHAFLRMKIVNKDLDLKKRCVFIHQNVSATTAEEKMMEARKNLSDTLDRMTIEAANLEDRRDIKSFSDVITFDYESDIWYFSGLWSGEPPMAPINPGYSENVVKVYNHIIENIARKQARFSYISDLADRVNDLWNGILTEDFVFSFRNCLEVKAYNLLEMQYYKIYWDMEKGIMKWVREVAGYKMTLCESDAALDTCVLSLKNEMSRMISKEERKAYDEMNNFFETHELRDKFIMWRPYKINALKHAATDFCLRAENEMTRRKKIRKLELLHENRNLQHEDKILTWAEELAKSQRQKKLSEKQIKDKFEEMWAKFLQQSDLSLSQAPVNIAELVEKSLWNVFYDNRPLLNEELRGGKLKTAFPFSKLIDSFGTRNISQAQVSVIPEMQEGWGKRRTNQNSWPAIQEEAHDITNDVLRHVEVYLNDLAQTDVGFPEDAPSFVIQIVLADLKKHNEKPDKDFTFLSNFKVKLAVHACQYAIGRFQMMVDDYEARHGVAVTLKSYKEKAFNLFKNTVDQRGGDVVIAELVCQCLKSTINKTVQEALPQSIITDVVTFFNTKYHLILALLDDLAFKRSFEKYKDYLYNPKDFARKWIKTFTHKHYFRDQTEPQLPHDSSKYAAVAHALIATMCDCIRQGVTTSCQDSGLRSKPRMENWITLFCSHVQNEIPLSTNALRHIQMRELRDIESFKHHLLTRVDALEAELVFDFLSVTAQTVTWMGTSPYEQIIDRLWGCPAECPFCGEVCQLTDPKHIEEGISHRCIQHRPSGVIGWHRDTGELNFETCSYRVSQNWSFRCARETCGQRFRECSQSNQVKTYHPYKEYKKYIPDWEIDPSPTMDSSEYWTWFMATYLDELVNYYRALRPQIPDSWNDITFEQARQSVRKMYL